MTSFECWSLTWDAATAIISFLGLLALVCYVLYTKKIADATELQGAILTYPTVSVQCGAGETPRQPYSEIRTAVHNGSAAHVHARINLKVVLHIAQSNQTVDFSAPFPYNGSLWDLASGSVFQGHFRVEGLEGRPLADGDTLTLEGTVESAVFGKENEYKPNPPVYYKWKSTEKHWVPNAPPTRS